MLVCEAHFWTKRDDTVVIPETDYGAFRYHEKNKKGPLYLETKKSFAAQSGASWNVQTKSGNPMKRDYLKELEELMSQQRVVQCVWRSHCILQLLFASGVFAYITVNPSVGDIEKIILDRYLLGKLAAECITDAVCTRESVVLAYSSNVITLVSLQKPANHPDKLNRQDPKLTNFELGGPAGRRLERKLSLGLEQNLVLVWWRYSQNEVYPWSPMTKDCDRANLLVYAINDSRLELKSFYKTEADPLLINFSRLHPNSILIVEQKVSLNGDVNVENSQFEIINGNITRTSPVDVLQLKTEVCSVALSPDEHTLSFGCIDGSVLLHSRSASILVKALFIPYHIFWHPDGAIMMAANEKGQIQCFDLALSPINLQLTSEIPQSCNFLDLTPYFRGQTHVSSICWNKKLDQEAKTFGGGDGLVFMMFTRGPCAALKVMGGSSGESGLSPDRIVCMYLNLNLLDNAVNLLGRISWENQGEDCLTCLNQIVNYLLSKRLSLAIEGQLEAVLGTFMSPTVPLSKTTEKRFGRMVDNLARKFFYHLLRFRRLDTAFRLAIDIGEFDLFDSLYHIAKAIKNPELARAAKEKLDEMTEDLESDSSSSVSHSCSRTSCSECSSDEHSSGSSTSETKLFEPVVSKNPKVTFSDTVTHIVASSATSAEEDDDEDDVVQSLIRAPPPRPPLMAPSPNVSGLPVVNPQALRVRPPSLIRDRMYSLPGPSRPPLPTSRSYGESLGMVDPPLNVHIAWKSVTTLTDPRTRTSITQVSEAFETLLMPQADLRKVQHEPFAMASHHHAEIRPRVSEVKSLSTLNKQARQLETPKVVEIKENNSAPEVRTVGPVVRPALDSDRNEIGLPLRTFRAVFSEPVDV